MGKSTTVAILLIACGFMGLAPSIAAGEPQSAMNIADNDRVSTLTASHFKSYQERRKATLRPKSKAYRRVSLVLE